MVLEAMVSESTMRDLLADLSGDEIRSVNFIDGPRGNEKVTLVGTNCKADRILEVAKKVQAGIAKDDISLRWDRLLVLSYSEAGTYPSDNLKCEICYWTDSLSRGF